MVQKLVRELLTDGSMKTDADTEVTKDDGLKKPDAKGDGSSKETDETIHRKFIVHILNDSHKTTAVRAKIIGQTILLQVFHIFDKTYLIFLLYPHPLWN